ncbi:hypothetical protein OsI_35768 [Oryza sativa Indica Group]|uniref:Uncharacterized protein n=1 Tax=Oryza sativa subsp. indica TaxID=39946 RepID=A2ZDA3_ORYSI|nr:hypothetical protein OsI_35768 [Oryza sativa Indica Group]
MGFCQLSTKNGVFFLTLGGHGGGENYRTEQFIAELEQKLKEVRGHARPSSKGLVTTFAAGEGGSFCDDVDNGGTSAAATAELAAYRTAEAVRALFDMPFPTAAAVAGDVRSSLALALVLAHDDMAVWKEATFEAPEVRLRRDDGGGGYLPPAPPPYVAALLRDKAPYPMMRSKLVLRSEAMDGSTFGGYWYMTDSRCDGREEVTGEAAGIVTTSIGKVRDGEAYVATRKSFFPESWKAVCEFLA